MIVEFSCKRRRMHVKCSVRHFVCVYSQQCVQKVFASQLVTSWSPKVRSTRTIVKMSHCENKCRFQPFNLCILNFIKMFYYVYYIMYLHVSSGILLSIPFTFCAKIPLCDSFDKLDGKYKKPFPIVRVVAHTILVFRTHRGGLKKNPLLFVHIWFSSLFCLTLFFFFICYSWLQFIVYLYFTFAV